MRERNKRNIVIGLLCVMVVFMSVGYAVLSQNLNINGTANITGSWKIEITDISPEEINEGKSVSTSIADSKIEGSFTANLKKPTDAVVYTVTVENKGTIDAVLERVTPEDYTSGDIKYTTTGKEECKNLDAGTTCDFTIKVEYLDTGVGQQPTPNGTEVEQQFEIKYVQEGANVNTPGGVPGGGEVDNSPAITVDSNGLVTGYNKEKLTNSEGYVVIPATTESGEEIVSIDENSFREYNIAMTYIYNEETDEEMYAYVIYDEENYDAIKNAILAQYNDSGSGSGSYSSSSSVLGKEINPINLTGNYNKTGILKKLSGSGSGDEEPPKIYSEIEFDLLVKEMETNPTISVEWYPEYMDIESGDSIEGGVAQIEKLDLTQAINLKTIGESAFQGSPLREVKLGNTVEIIGDNAFASTNLTTVTIPASVKEIRGSKDDGAFCDSQISTLIFEENSSIQIIGESAFEGNLITGKLLIPTSVTTIGRYAFASNQISEVEINHDVANLSGGIFNENQIENIIIKEGVTKIPAFNDQRLTTLNLPSTITIIESYKFSGNQISELTIPSNVTTIEDYAFWDNLISDLTFEDTETNPSKLTTIGNYAFSSNEINSTLVIPSNVTTIGSGAFAYNQISESTLVFEDTETNPSKLTSLVGFGYNKFTKLPTLPKSVTTIGSGAFAHNQISELTIPEGVKTIEDSAFSSNQIIELSIPNSITTILSYAFYGENNLLTTLNIDMSKIPGGSIFSNKKIEKLIIGPNVTEIGDKITSPGVFENNQITELIFEEKSKVSLIGDSAFSRNKISELTIPESVTIIGLGAFENNNITGEIVIPSSVTTIGYEAFFENPNLNTIIIKRADSTGMTLGSGWSDNAQVVYNPNYAG